MRFKRDYLNRLEHYLHDLEKDEIIIIFILWRMLHQYHTTQTFPVNIHMICQRAKITEERYEEIMTHLAELDLIRRGHFDTSGHVETVTMGLPKHYRTNLKLLSKLI